MKIFFETLKILIENRSNDGSDFYKEKFNSLATIALNKFTLDYLKKYLSIDFGNSELDKKLTAEKLTHILNIINKRFDDIENAHNVVFVLGDIGSGKSTLINRLCGIELSKSEHPDLFCTVVDSSESIIVIGHGSQVETLLPTAVNKKGITYVEIQHLDLKYHYFPEHDFANWASQRVVSRAKHVLSTLFTLAIETVRNGYSLTLHYFGEMAISLIRKNLPIQFVISKNGNEERGKLPNPKQLQNLLLEIASHRLKSIWLEELSSNLRKYQEEHQTYSTIADEYEKYITSEECPYLDKKFSRIDERDKNSVPNKLIDNQINKWKESGLSEKCQQKLTEELKTCFFGEHPVAWSQQTLRFWIDLKSVHETKMKEAETTIAGLEIVSKITADSIYVVRSFKNVEDVEQLTDHREELLHILSKLSLAEAKEMDLPNPTQSLTIPSSVNTLFSNIITNEANPPVKMGDTINSTFTILKNS